LCSLQRRVAFCLQVEERAEAGGAWAAWNGKYIRRNERELNRHRKEFTEELNRQLLRSFPTLTKAGCLRIRDTVCKNIRSYWKERDGCEEPFNGLEQVLHHGFAYDYRNILQKGIEDTPLSRV